MNRNKEIFIMAWLVSVSTAIVILISAAKAYSIVSTTNSFPATLLILTSCIFVSCVFCWVIALRIGKDL